VKLGKLLKAAATKARENPEVALMLLGLVAPKVVTKAAPIIVAVTRPKGAAGVL
jgi:hypothetical protein